MDALPRVGAPRRQVYCFVVEADVRSFFDSIPHDPRVARAFWKISDKGVLALLALFVRGPLPGLSYTHQVPYYTRIWGSSCIIDLICCFSGNSWGSGTRNWSFPETPLWYNTLLDHLTSLAEWGTRPEHGPTAQFGRRNRRILERPH